MDIRPVLQCVDIMNNPWSSAEQEQESNDYLNQFLKSPDYHLVAVEIMQSEDPSIQFVDLAQVLDISFDCRFYAVNILIEMFNKDWKVVPNSNQRFVLQFLETYLDSGVSVNSDYLYDDRGIFSAISHLLGSFRTCLEQP